jgi:ribonucleoside-diphosphate reductase alpha chain
VNKGTLQLLKQRYLWEWKIDGKKKQETPEQMVLRVAKKVASGYINIMMNKHKEVTSKQFDTMIATVREKAHLFYDMIISGDFIPSSPQLFNAMRGFSKDQTDKDKYEIIYKPIDKMTDQEWVAIAEFKNSKAAYGSCYSMGRIGDSIDDIYRMLTEQAHIFKASGGFGVSFSNLRANGTVVESTKGVSCGPLGFMNLFNDNTKLIALEGKLKRGRYN